MLATATVEREVLSRALRVLAKGISTRTHAQVVVTCRAGHLVFQRSGSGVKAEVPAEASWAGRLCIPAAQIAVLARHLPAGDQVMIRVQPGKYSVAGLTLPATWHDKSIGDVIEVNENAELLELLRLSRTQPAETIAQSGLAKIVADAEQRLETILKRAVITLRPLGITEEDLRKILDARVKQPHLP